jgi:hypoxanthine phosphoribosyltransferase
MSNSFILSETEIKSAVKEMAQKLSVDYDGKPLLAVCVLKGAVMFYTDLIREFSTPVVLDFVAVSSYGSETTSSGLLDFRARTKMDDAAIQGYHVLIVEDVIDSGNTLYWLKKYFESKHPLSVKVCTLLDKPARRSADIQADYSCFTIPDKFIVGYGLDHNELYRDLPYIAEIDYVKELY